MILPAVLFGLFQQSNLQDIHIPAASLERVIQQVSDQYHSPMTISTNLRNQILVVEARQVSESQVRDQIAKAVDGTWEKKDSGWHLGQSAKQLGMERERRDTLRLRMLQKTLEFRLNSHGFKTPLTATSAVGLYNQVKSQQGFVLGPAEAEFGEPTQRFVTKILAKMDLRQIAGVDNGERRVFALKPNAMQIGLDISLDKEIDEFRKDKLVWSDAIKQFERNSDAETKSSESHLTHRTIDTDLMTDDLDNVLVCAYTSSSGPQELTFFFLPKNPRESFLMSQANSAEGLFALLTNEDLDPKAANQKDFKLSEESQDFAKFYGQDSASIPSDRLSHLLQQVADPVKRDPLSFGVSEMIAFDSRKSNQNIVAVLSDEDFTNEGLTFSNLEIFKKIEDVLGGVIVHEDGWIRLNFRTLEGPTFPRPILKRIIANVRARQKLTLEDLAEIEATGPRSQNESSIIRFIEGFVPQARDENGEDDAIRAMGLLDMKEQNRAMSPSGIAYGELSPKMRQHLFECVYFNQRSQLKNIGDFRSLPNFSWAEEPTLMAPTGIANDSVFHIYRDDQTQIRVTSKDQPEGFWASTRELGELKFRMENPKDFPENADCLDLTKPMSRATKLTFQFVLLVNRSCSWTSNLERTISAADAPFQFESMPDDLKRQVDLSYRTAKENWDRAKAKEKSSGKGGGGR